jgi:hypothetical protein
VGEVGIGRKSFLGDGDGDRCVSTENMNNTGRSPVIPLMEAREAVHTTYSTHTSMTQASPASHCYPLFSTLPHPGLRTEQRRIVSLIDSSSFQ